MSPENSKAVDILGTRWLDVYAAADYLAISPHTLRGLVHRAELKASTIGKNLRFDRVDLDNYMIRRKRFFKPYRKGTRPWVAKRWKEFRKKASR